MSNRDEHLKSIGEIAAMLGLDVPALLNWMDDNGWGYFGDSFNVMPHRIECGDIVNGKSGTQFTPQGVQSIRRELNRPLPAEAVCDVDVDEFSDAVEVPF